MAILVPFTLLIIFFLIYLNTRSVIKTFIVLLAVPFSLVGAFWMLYLLNYNMSVAVWVGLIALAGLDAETGVVMLLYLDQAWEKAKAQGRMSKMEELYSAVVEGAVQRIRPKIMTVCAIIFGLLPIMWSPVYQAGADVMKRIATPMIGGVITSAILELLIYPVIYVIWRKRSLPPEPPAGVSTSWVDPEPKTVSSGARRRILAGSTTVLLAGVVIAAGYFSWSSGIANSIFKSADQKMPVAKFTQDGVTVSILSSDGEIHARDNALRAEENNPDLECMIRLREGDDLALNELMERWQKPLHSFILRYVGNHRDSVELAAETFVRVYQHRSRFNFKSKFSTWLLTIATNLCRHHARWRQRHPTISLDEAASSDEVSGEHLFISAEEIPSVRASRTELAKLVREEIQKLPHDLKTAVLLFAYDDLSYAEIGVILGCTPKAVETRLYRVRKLLAKRLAAIF